MSKARVKRVNKIFGLALNVPWLRLPQLSVGKVNSVRGTSLSWAKMGGAAKASELSLTGLFGVARWAIGKKLAGWEMSDQYIDSDDGAGLEDL